MPEKDKLLECGKIINTHGVRGNLKIESWCDSVEVFCAIKSSYIEKKTGFVKYNVVSATEHKNCALVKLEGVDDMDSALLLKNKVVFAEREHIPVDEDAVFIADMIGLDVYRSTNGEKLGVLTDIFESVASDIYVITPPDGREVMVPGVDAFIDEIDLDHGITISPIPGMFED